jgi:hypothetical protein
LELPLAATAGLVYFLGDTRIRDACLRSAYNEDKR